MTDIKKKNRQKFLFFCVDSNAKKIRSVSIIVLEIFLSEEERRRRKKKKKEEEEEENGKKFFGFNKKKFWGKKKEKKPRFTRFSIILYIKINY